MPSPRRFSAGIIADTAFSHSQGQKRSGDGSNDGAVNLAANMGKQKISLSLARVPPRRDTDFAIRKGRRPIGNSAQKTKTPPPQGEAAFCLIVTRKEELLCPWQAWQRPTLPGL